MQDIEKYVLRLADNALILSHRLSEWCSKGPTLEEDIAISNISLDLLGRANSLLEYSAKINGKKSAVIMHLREVKGNFIIFRFVNLKMVILEIL